MFRQGVISLKISFEYLRRLLTASGPMARRLAFLIRVKKTTCKAREYFVWSAEMAFGGSS